MGCVIVVLCSCWVICFVLVCSVIILLCSFHDLFCLGLLVSGVVVLLAPDLLWCGFLCYAFAVFQFLSLLCIGFCVLVL